MPTPVAAAGLRMEPQATEAAPREPRPALRVPGWQVPARPVVLAELVVQAAQESADLAEQVVPAVREEA